jgi:hypothetical protein
MIAATILIAILAAGVYFLGLRTAQTGDEVSRTLPAFITFGVLSLMAAFFALGDYLDAILPRQLEPVYTLADLQGQVPLAEGDPVLLVGQTIERVEYHASQFTNVELDDAVIPVEGQGYLAGRWDMEEDDSRYLNPAAPVVVLSRSTGAGTELISRYIFQGTYDEYIAFIPRFQTVPLITMALSLALGLLCFILPFVYRRQVRRADG